MLFLFGALPVAFVVFVVAVVDHWWHSGSTRVSHHCD